MTRWLAAAIAAALYLVGSDEAEAQRRRAPPPPAERAEPGPSYRWPDNAPRTGLYSHPPGYTGTIMWNTPDANGNFSTATGGGGSGP